MFFSSLLPLQEKKKVFSGFSLFFSLPHSKDWDFANASETSHGVKIAPQHDRVVMRSPSSDLNLGRVIPCTRGMIHGIWQWHSSLPYENLSENS